MLQLEYETPDRSTLGPWETAIFWAVFAMTSLIGSLAAMGMDERLGIFGSRGSRRINADHIAIHIACIALAAGLSAVTRVIRGRRRGNAIFAVAIGLFTAPALFGLTALFAAM